MNTAENAFGMPLEGPAKEPDRIDLLGATAAIAAITAVGVAIGLSFPLLSFLLEQRQYSSSLIGANTAMAGIASIAAVPFINPFARRVGLVNTLCLAAIVAAVSLVCFYLYPSIWVWFGLRVTFHGAITASFVLSEFWINSSVPERQRGFVLGIYATVLSLGFAAGPALLALLGTNGAMPFVIGALVIIVSTLPSLAAKRHQPSLVAEPQSRSVLRYVALVPLASAAAFIFGAVEQSGLALFPVYGARTGYDETQIALLLTVLAFGNVALQIPLGLASDRMRDRRPLLFGCAAIGALGTAILPIAVDWPTALTLGIFIWGGVTAGMYTIGLAHLGSRLSGPDLAQANAAFVLCYAVGMVIGPYLAGTVMDLSGAHGFAYTLFGLFATYLVLVGARWRSNPAGES